LNAVTLESLVQRNGLHIRRVISGNTRLSLHG